MATFAMGSLPSLRRQQLLSEFAGLKQACPEGVFVSLTPEDPSLWAGVLFVRDGPYAPAILRFQISFPDSYPRLPPLVTFSTDMFHPLITPLTTYMYTTDIQDNGTVSATDEERLPPGGFSLRHGFPEWFGRGRKNTAGSRRISGQKGSEATLNPADTKRIGPPSKPAPADEAPIYAQTNRKHVSTYEVLRYIRSTFDDGEVLDSVPLAAAGNPGAWHAWRTHRRATGKLAEKKTEDDTKEQPEKEETKETEAEVEASPESKPQKVPPPTAKHPGEWNWEGVWEDRVKKGIAQSLSEPVLYGATSASDEMIRFLNMEDSEVKSVKDNLHRTLGNVP